ncbi:DUF4304 domain-containing protein [Flavobacterium lindanitolerans]|uniref:Uncharacterized protein DUF4304 n=1 Tax=Flavobacterium lindanitolerans TaxID=428988 RepID=A0A497V3X7_9FLAO|nr:DUF4304 domain-containing protein [Flavobacterium lindanitolerans]PKW29234.1 uncharacterized protein DUF4304 [Flavobacterium lindanitolerans]RLJ35265.1 uncharacterized protein DUF4304 [Flavobacterium lindanitolerans]
MENSIRYILKWKKTELLNLLNNIFLPLGFKRKGNSWVLNGNEINKIINLQKSQYGNVYYLHYNYVINSLPLNNRKVHIDNQLGSIDKEEQAMIQGLLDLESDIDTADRLIKLFEVINKKIVPELNQYRRKMICYKSLKDVSSYIQYLHTY